MKYNTQANIINTLVKKAQTTINDDIRADAIAKLWDICGNQIVRIMAGKSYTIDSDFSMRDFSHSERCDNLMGDAFFVFHDAVLRFDATLGVPFMAFLTQKITWGLLSAKRENSKQSKREKETDFSLESYSSSKDLSDEESKMINLLKNIQSDEDFEEDCYRKEGVQVIKQIIKKNQKLLDYFTICQEICNEGDKCTDAEVARHLGCTRANVGQLRRKFYQTLVDNGLINDCRMLMAA